LNYFYLFIIYYLVTVATFIIDILKDEPTIDVELHIKIISIIIVFIPIINTIAMSGYLLDIKKQLRG
jgi:hypothetical protein